MLRREAGQVFRFAPGLLLRAEGDISAVSHFGREYAPSATDGGPEGATLLVRFEAMASRDGGPATGEWREDAHRWLRWAVAVSPPSTVHAEATIGLGGRPRSVLLSLVQGYVVEPLLSLMAPSVGQVLVPGAAIRSRQGAVLVLGGSGAGKSTLCARAAAAGIPVLGDDQVLLDGDGVCRPFPRRVRIYPDLAVTAPAAFGHLPRRAKARLAAHAVLAATTGGRVRPSLPLDRRALGPERPADAEPLARVVIVNRGARGLRQLRADDASLPEVIATAQHLLRAQRARLLSVIPAGWRANVDRVASRERAMMNGALHGVDVLRLLIPPAWSASRAVDTVAEAAGVGTIAAAAAHVDAAVAGRVDAAR